MKRIYGYYFKVVAEPFDGGFVAYAPGVGGVYEEADTREEAINKAYETACILLDTRIKMGEPLNSDNEYLKVLDIPPTRKNIDRYSDIPDGYISTSPCSEPALASR